MITKNEFTRIMETQSEIALATSVNNQPNVRIVNFYFEEQTNTLFFTTFGDNDKVKEFLSNPNIAFTTIPQQSNEHVKAKGVVRKSERTVAEMADCFISKVPDYKDTIEQAGEYLLLFEIKLDTVIVTLDFENSSILNLV